ncbi:MAG: HD domain-containing protein [Butyrivibrio sp.]|nr:HD domain-containing protein [Butyrivibrio sp.]
MYKASKNRAKKWIVFILFLFLGIIFNLIFNAFANRFLDKILYLDSIGTMVVAVIGGYFPGVFVALITNVITFIDNPPSVYFVILNIFTAMWTTYYYKKYKSVKKNLAKYLSIYVLVVAFCNSLFAGIINFLQGIDKPHGDGLIDSYIVLMMQITGMNFYMAHFIINFVIHIMDKFICIMISYLIIKKAPGSMVQTIKNVGWLQRPLDDDMIKTISKKTSRKLSIKSKIGISLFAACIAITTVIALLSRMLFMNYMDQKFHDEAKGISRLVASTIESDRVSDYIELGEDAYGYRKTENLLYNISIVTPNIQYIFVYKVSDDGYTVVFDLDTDDLVGEDPGTHVDFDKSVLPYVEAMKAGEEFEPYITDDDNIGYFLTSLTPVFDDDGNCVCYAGADISMEDYEVYQSQFMIRLICLCFGFMVMIILAGLWIAEYHMIYPINTIIKTADNFEYEDEESRIKNVDSIRDIGIHTGDEIENMFYTFLQTIEENMFNYSTMMQKSKDLDEVQTGLIMVLADLVENRDSSTGDHIRKTATYTGIVMRKMRELGFYTNELTDDFMSNVIKSAPLHDIGKIQISDSILNKPGKLTDEEFEIMKKHTIFGARVIDQCISSLPDSEYLEEAKNIAAYHHEKWNGKGYPTGLKGEEIPLSARIMAVADVFDALVSKRVYKDAFSFDKAMGIIIDEAGIQFDPKVAQAFVAASDEVKAAAESFERNKVSELLGKDGIL